MVQGIDHIELIVRDVEAFVALFWQLGFRLLVRATHHGESAELQLPSEVPDFATCQRWSARPG